MRHAKPRITAHLHALLSLTGEVARNAVAELRWRRQQERRARTSYEVNAVT